jgi:hypothetical protein
VEIEARKKFYAVLINIAMVSYAVELSIFFHLLNNDVETNANVKCFIFLLSYIETHTILPIKVSIFICYRED